MPEVLTRSVAQTEDAARSVAALVDKGGVIAIEGELGAGKTQFVRGLVDALGGDPRQVSSPTFVVMQGYSLADRRRLWHFDAYRCAGPGDFEAIGFDEVLAAAVAEGDVAAIEWPSRVTDLIPPDAVRVTIEPLDETTRRLSW
jgi:tRNA threonylcarbamoyl adenosine modification protein YjeE